MTPARRFALSVGVIATLALTVRVLVILLVDPQVPALGDASAYHLLANNLADGLGYIRPFDRSMLHLDVPTAEYPPLFPFVLGIVARLGVRSVEGQRLAMGVAGSGTVVLVAYLGRRLAGDAVGIVAALLAAVYPMLFLADATLMSETLFAFLVTAALLLAYAVHDRPSAWRWAALGVVLGLATLTRAEAATLALLLVVPLAVGATSLAAARRVGMAALAMGLVVLVVAPWSIRNWRTFDAFVPVSNNIGTALAGANCRLTYGGPSLGSWRSTFREGDTGRGECFTGFNGAEPGFDEAAAAADARRQGLDYARAHGGQLPKVAGARVLRTFGAFRVGQQNELEALEGRPLGWERAGTWMYWLLVPFGVAGFVLLVRRRSHWWPLAAPVATVVISSLVTYGNQRFRVAAEPTLLVCAAVALVALASRIRARSGPDHVEPGKMSSAPA
ncbi:MAG: hypothetical protein FJW88_06165 [Actinobacteria bacterium]|nr:hypothetical protein [Actinomycetota bacterium]